MNPAVSLSLLCSVVLLSSFSAQSHWTIGWGCHYCCLDPILFHSACVYGTPTSDCWTWRCSCGWKILSMAIECSSCHHESGPPSVRIWCYSIDCQIDCPPNEEWILLSIYNVLLSFFLGFISYFILIILHSLTNAIQNGLHWRRKHVLCHS